MSRWRLPEVALAVFACDGVASTKGGGMLDLSATPFRDGAVYGFFLVDLHQVSFVGGEVA